jgi:hypothetical protein
MRSVLNVSMFTDWRHRPRLGYTDPIAFALSNRPSDDAVTRQTDPAVLQPSFEIPALKAPDKVREFLDVVGRGFEEIFRFVANQPIA